MPNITGSYGSTGWYLGYGGVSGSWYMSKVKGERPTYDAYKSDSCILGMDASRSSSVYGSSDTVTPESIETKMCIKY